MSAIAIASSLFDVQCTQQALHRLEQANRRGAQPTPSPDEIKAYGRELTRRETSLFERLRGLPAANEVARTPADAPA